MKSHAKAYAYFLGFILITKLVVVPAAKQFNVPLVKDL